MEQLFTVALVGYPHGGKTTVFSRLTGLRQHTGSWAGKTVGQASGICRRGERSYLLLDIPGCYSLSTSQAEVRNLLCFSQLDAVALICDATALQRNLNLALQIIETGRPVVVAINLLVEARRSGLRLDLAALETALGVPVVGICARKGQGLEKLLTAISSARPGNARPLLPQPVAAAAATVTAALKQEDAAGLNRQWLALRLLENNRALVEAWELAKGGPISPAVTQAVETARQQLDAVGWNDQRMSDALAASRYREAVALAASVSSGAWGQPRPGQLRADRFLTRRSTGIPAMLLLLLLLFFLTIQGAQWPSAWLSTALFTFQDTLSGWLLTWGAPVWFHGLLVEGVYPALAWVISAMLPPMMIFFPLFSLFEDMGYWPRLAFHLDRCFHCCKACGKQALTMCMGFGCNAVAVTGCRSIESPREKRLAILTNAFVPCNGKYPLLIMVLSAFFVGAGRASGLLAAAMLTGLIFLSIGLTLLTSWLLSATVLRGQVSALILELPPYRKPQILSTIAHSMTDQIIIVLGRAALVAAPAGAVLWLLSNFSNGGLSLLSQAAAFLEPAGRFLGLDGVILLSFLLAIPANELVLPFIVTCYLSCGAFTDLEGMTLLRALLTANGWSWLTACNTLLFTLLHWPCATTLLTIRKETKSWAWTALAFALPTTCGILLCALTAALFG